MAIKLYCTQLPNSAVMLSVFPACTHRPDITVMVDWVLKTKRTRRRSTKQWCRQSLNHLFFFLLNNSYTSRESKLHVPVNTADNFLSATHHLAADGRAPDLVMLIGL